MLKQLIPAGTPLLIQNNLEAIHCACIILDFMILAKYILHVDKTLTYVEHTLYIYNKTKMVFGKHHSNDV